MVPQDQGSSSSSDDAQSLDTLIHDLRHCLFVVRTGLPLLKQSARSDEFDRLRQSLIDEERKASALLIKLIAAARLEDDTAG